MNKQHEPERGEDLPVVFTPDNEPYLGRELLRQYDLLISASMEANTQCAPRSYQPSLSDHQRMAGQVIPQALSVALSMRELVRQGYLFGAFVLLRALVERAVILQYLNLYPDEIQKWNNGWLYGEAPGLPKMLDAIQARWQDGPQAPGRNMTAFMNSLLHAKPDSAPWNLVPVGDSGAGHAPSKILNRPDLCDELCSHAIPWLVVVQAMMNAYFPDPRQ